MENRTRAGIDNSWKHINEADLIENYEELVKQQLKQGENPIEKAEELCRINIKAVIIMREMGSGLIPMEAFERELREQCGRVSCVLAKEAQQVYRIQCGIGQILKDIRETTGDEKEI